VSIKAKLSLLISFMVTIILSLSISIYYYSSKAEQQKSVQKQMLTIAKQIGTSLDASEKSRRFMEEKLGEKLRATAIAAQNELGPQIDHVRNEELVRLSHKLDIDHITLWKRTVNDIVVMKSSDPAEIGQGSNTWDYWYTAFGQLFAEQKVTIPQGQILQNFWSGPFQYSTSDPQSIKKWGYYYDGTTDYLINPYIDAKGFLDFEHEIGTDALIGFLMKDNTDIVEITGFDSHFFGKPPILKLRGDELVRNLDVRDIVFGQYSSTDIDQDVAYVNDVSSSGRMLTTAGVLKGKPVIKSFIPMSDGMNLVVGISFDREVIQHFLNRQLFIHCMIAIGLILFSWVISYFIAGLLIKPLRHILDNINEIAEGRFSIQLAIHSQDEIGLLSAGVNKMADNLKAYMGKLQDSAEVIRRTEKLSVVGQLAAGVAHEIRNPLTTLKGFVQLQKEKGSITDSHLDIMLSELDRINFIVSEFLVLAKPQHTHYESVHIQGIIDDMIRLLDSHASLSHVEFETRIAGNIPPVLCEINQLKQVFVNVMKNSIEAMKDGGTVKLELSCDDKEPYVVIRIMDQGSGISEEDLVRLGEPFFTSKPLGNGLGLMVSQRIIANHKGMMNISSTLGIGTCVEIKLPIN
jgi:signal transduction histidine kinase